MNAQDVEAVREALSRGAHKGGHHPRCATRHDDEGCDCYARHTYPSRAAFDRILADNARLREALQRIAGVWVSGIAVEREVERMYSIARDALAEEKPWREQGDEVTDR